MVICEECGRLAQVDEQILAAAIQSLQQQSNYRIQHYWLQLSGLCAECPVNGSPN